MLVVADPAPEPELQLVGRAARRTGSREGAEELPAKPRDLSLEVVDRIGSAECDPIEILALLLSGDFDIVHFAGHGDFDKKDPGKAAGSSAAIAC